MKDYLTLARQYEDDVIARAIPACRWVRLACERNRRDSRRQSAVGFPYVIDAEKAIRICQAAEQLPHIKGEHAFVTGTDEDGRSIWNTITLEPWQCWLLTTIFGWVHVSTRLRRYKTALVLVPRKNAKSTLGAIVVLYMLTSDGESGAECYSAATTRDQAKVVAEIAWEMARRSPAFRDYFGVRIGAKTTRVLEVPETASKFMPLSADANSLDGLNVSLAVVDELHAHKTRAVWDVLDTATGARRQPLLLPITTAGVDIGGICHEKMSYLHRVLDRAVEDETFFGINYTIDAEDDWRQESTWRKANPNYGVSVNADDLARKAREAESSSAGVNNFLTKHLNVWVRAESTWAPLEKWIANGDATLTPDQMRGVPCWIGVDLAEVRDISAIVLVFKRGPNDYVVFGRYYVTEASVRRSPVAQYGGWVRDGRLIETDGDQADYARIEDDLVTLCQTYKVQKVCFDRALAAQMGQQLAKRLGARPEVLTVNQNVEVMNPAMQTVERLILSGHLKHDGDPVLTWMMSNVVAKPIGNRDEVFPVKAGGKDSPNKIDGAVALFTAMSQAAVTSEPTAPSMFFLGGKR